MLKASGPSETSRRGWEGTRKAAIAEERQSFGQTLPFSLFLSTMAMQTFVSYESRFSRIYAKQLFIIQTLVKHSMLFSYIGLSKCDCMQMNVLQTLIARFHHPFLFPVSEENTSFLKKKRDKQSI
jgi:hypothetical protein